MSSYYYSLGMILLGHVAGGDITQESVRILMLRNLLADEENT